MAWNLVPGSILFWPLDSAPLKNSQLIMVSHDYTTLKVLLLSSLLIIKMIKMKNLWTKRKLLWTQMMTPLTLWFKAKTVWTKTKTPWTKPVGDKLWQVHLKLCWDLLLLSCFVISFLKLLSYKFSPRGLNVLIHMVFVLVNGSLLWSKFFLS